MKHCGDPFIDIISFVRTLEVSEVALLVERGALETERVDNIVDLDSSVLNTLISLLSRSVSAGV